MNHGSISMNYIVHAHYMVDETFYVLNWRKKGTYNSHDEKLMWVQNLKEPKGEPKGTRNDIPSQATENNDKKGIYSLLWITWKISQKYL